MKMITEEFIQKAKQIHGDKYDYSKVNYIDSKTKIYIICYKHGEFLQSPNGHLNGYGCKKCRSELMRLKLQKTTEQFIKEAILIYGNKYNYSEVNYINNNIKVKIKCKEHGIFEMIPRMHLNIKDGNCPKCKYKKLAFQFKKYKNNEDYIIDCKKIHGDKYDYSLTEYKNSKDKVRIICPFHGEFKQRSISHLKGDGCFKCYEPHGEKRIQKYLEDKKIEYKRNYVYKDCKYIHPLRFDFYIYSLNLLIEYQGKQHYELVNFRNKMSDDKVYKNFEVIKIRDHLKKEYCKNNNIPLLEIHYKDFKNIESILDSVFINTYKV